MKTLKNLLQMSLVFFCLFSTSNSHAQSPVGLWSEATYQIQLQLNADGSYVLQNAQGMSYGQYSLQGNQFWMQDTYGNTWAYTAHLLTAANFQISDPNGVVMNFVNQNVGAASQPTASMASTPTVSVPWEASTYNRELANTGGQTLKEREVKIYATLLEFLIEANLQPHEMTQLQQAVVADFEANPSALLQDAGQVGEALKVIYAQTDAMQIGLARQNLFANLHAYTLQNPALQQSAFFKILYQHLKVVAFDSANQLVLTDKDVAAYLKYVEFSNELAGGNQVIGENEKQVFQQELAGGFQQLPLEQKQVFCSARLLWQVVEANWKQLTAAQQQQVKSSMQQAQTITSNSYVGGGGASANPPIHHQPYEQQTAEEMVAQMEADNKRWAAEKGMTVEEYLEYRRGFNASMPILQRASMESHATMMNVINNLGGGNDSYWSVHDVDSAGNINW